MGKGKTFLGILLLGFMVVSGLLVRGLAAAPLTNINSDLFELTISDGETGDRFGSSVAMDGDTAVIGVTYADSAYVFRRWVDGSWNEVQRLTVSEVVDPTRFGYTVDISNDTAVVGTNETKVAYVFGRDVGGPDSWGQVKKITTDGGTNELDGFDVAIDKDTIAIGYPVGEVVYVHERDSGSPNNWGLIKKLSVDEIGISNFGGAVAISGDLIAVVAEEVSGRIVVYLFQRDEGGPDNWEQIKKLSLDDDGGEEDIFESHELLALDNNTLVVGSYDASVTIPDTVKIIDTINQGQGTAYIFERDAGGPGNWGREKKLVASDGDDSHWFGYSVAISGDKVIIGAVWADVGNNDKQGATYIFHRDEGGPNNWGETEKLISSGGAERDYFGASVATSGTEDMIGASGADYGSGENQGKVYYTKRVLPPFQTWLPLIR